MGQPAFFVTFWAKPSDPNAWPLSWIVNHDGPLAAAEQAANATMIAGIFPSATRFKFHDYATNKQVYPDA